MARLYSGEEWGSGQLIMGIKSSDFYFGKYKGHHIVTTNKINQKVSLTLTADEYYKFNLFAELLGMSTNELLLLIYERRVFEKWGMVERTVRTYEIRG